jgi:hypothetical protein
MEGGADAGGGGRPIDASLDAGRPSAENGAAVASLVAGRLDASLVAGRLIVAC